MTSSAVFDNRGMYRYVLSRVWDQLRPICNFVMFNPSKAGETDDDPTIRRCIGFARRMGFGGIRVTNLFAYCATNPAALWKAEDNGIDIIGPRNDHFIEIEARSCRTVIAAWGNLGAFHELRIARVLPLFYGRTIHAIKMTKLGQPVHPVRQAYSTNLEIYSVGGAA